MLVVTCMVASVAGAVYHSACVFTHTFHDLYLYRIENNYSPFVGQMHSLLTVLKSLNLRFRQTQKLRYKQMEIFINAPNKHPQISLILLNVVSFYNPLYFLQINVY